MRLLSFKGLVLSVALITAAANPSTAQQPLLETSELPTRQVVLPGLQLSGQVLLPNGWSLAPAGKQISLGDFPVNVALSPDGKFAAVLHAGFGDHEVRIISIANQKQVSSARIEQCFFGLVFSTDGKTLFASGAEDECVYAFPVADGFLAAPRVIEVADESQKFVVSGLTPGANSGKLFACGLLAHQLAEIDLNDSTKPRRLQLPNESFPYSVMLDEKSHRAYVSLWGKAAVAVIDIENWRIFETWPSRSHPTEMLLLDDGRWLLVACSDDNSVVLLDTATGQQREVIRTALYASAKNGSTPASMDLSPDGKVLLVANANNNNLAMFDIIERGRSRSLGFIPVGWYPTSVRFSRDGQTILVANGKGLTSRSNRHGPNPNVIAPATVREYIGGLFQGTLSLIDAPSPAEMAQLTRTVFEVSPLQESNSIAAKSPPAGNPIPVAMGGSSPIKHCVYIIKENRTYDQVFGDIPKGNGDPSLCIFPEKVTPNHHALVNEFVLLDNFYVESEVSADGHEWSMAAYANDFVEKSWPLTYRGGRDKLTYPAEGKFKIAEPSSGYIWDRCRERGVSYFSFGEFVDNGPTANDPVTTKMEALQGHFDPHFRSYDLDYRDTLRAERFIERWKQFETEGKLPQFIVLRLPNDHTYGTRAGKPTPTAMVADNDLGLGMVIEAISHSPAWKETAIFVVEDDAQNGADHVDAHRTVALVISPYVRRRTVDSTLYSTSSMLRTMELILGLEPMTQFDAAATPMYSSFHATPDFTSFTRLRTTVDMEASNLASAWGAQLSEELDLSSEDAADDLLLGDIVWRSVRGAGSPMPPPVRAAFVFAEIEKEETEGGDNDEQAKP